VRAALPENWLAPANLTAASQAQREIAQACETEDRFGPIHLIAGMDTSMKWRDSRGPVHAAAAPLAWPLSAPCDAASVSMIPPIPYVPGYLGFREVPAMIAAIGRLQETPDLLLVDGHGRSHPRRCGTATHLGVLLDVPAIGCAKTLLCGKPAGELGPQAGDRVPLIDRGEVVGVVLRTRSRALPIYVSTGHRISLEHAVDWVLKLCDGRRLPVPIRMAHDAANAARRAADQ
jgi:deoxyribonuclease V